jgi:hypothetical protein
VTVGHFDQNGWDIPIYLAATMPHLGPKQSWRQRLGSLTDELIVVFAGVSAALVVKNYRDEQHGTGPSRSTRSRSILEVEEL